MGVIRGKLREASQTGVRGSLRSRGAGLGGGGRNGHVSLAPPATFGPVLYRHALLGPQLSPFVMAVVPGRAG